MEIIFSPEFIVSQILMLIAFVCIASAFQIKESKKFRTLFVLAGVFAGVHFLLIGAVTAAVVVFVNAIRWFSSIFSKSKLLIIVFVLAVIATTYVTWDTWISILPGLGGVLGTLAAFNENEQRTRKILMGATSLWIVHNTLVMTPVGIVSEIVFLTSNIVGFIRHWKKKKPNKF